MESLIFSHSSSSTCKTIPDSPNCSGKSCSGILTLAMKKAYPLDVLETPSNSGSLGKTFSEEKLSPSILRCLECSETFQHNVSLRQHYLENHIAPKQYEGTTFNCPNCKLSFPCVITLKVHQQEHVLPNVQQFSSNRSNHNPPRRLLSISYACHICDKSFNTIELLVEHANVHLLGHLCNNDTCQKLYGNQHRHINNTSTTSGVGSNPKTSNHVTVSPQEIREDKPATIKGPKLPAAIKARRNSSKNEPCIVNVHGRKRFQCKVCHKLLSSKLSHEEHFRGVHTNFKPYSCSICAKSFAVKNTYRQHMAAHSIGVGSSPSSSTEADNNNSICVIHYTCSICGENFPSSEKLDYHSCSNRNQSHNRNSNPSIKRGELFKCKICGKVFTRREWRTKHYLSHGGESCFRCEICGDIFPDEQFYLIHAQVHFKKSLLNCNVCGKTFPGKDLYERHSCRFAGVGSSG